MLRRRRHMLPPPPSQPSKQTPIPDARSGQAPDDPRAQAKPGAAPGRLRGSTDRAENPRAAVARAPTRCRAHAIGYRARARRSSACFAIASITPVSRTIASPSLNAMLSVGEQYLPTRTGACACVSVRAPFGSRARSRLRWCVRPWARACAPSTLGAPSRSRRRKGEGSGRAGGRVFTRIPAHCRPQDSPPPPPPPSAARPRCATCPRPRLPQDRQTRRQKPPLRVALRCRTLSGASAARRRQGVGGRVQSGA